MAALMADVALGHVTPSVANATANVGGKLLKLVDMQYKHGAGRLGAKSQPFLLTGK